LLIDKEKIAEAKERLGDRNAEIIAEELNLENYDSRNKKACCPYHQEKTPSFIYNPKKYNFKCFGCSKSVDIIDVFMEKGLTYIEAVEKLFELAGIQYIFGEKNVKTKSSYRYPKEVECSDKSKIYEYLKTRCISQETVDYCDVRQDEQGNIVFNYYDINDVLTTVKYRPSRKVLKGENKVWCQKGADTSPILFNMNRINVTKPLVICEGEIDCMAVIESGYSNAVSVPFGAGNYHWIEENWDWLEQFENIIICSDNDDAGTKMQKEVVYRLGSWRCKIVNIPPSFKKEDGTRVKIKDLNEVLYYYGKDKVIDLIINASDTPISSITDISDIEDVDLDKIDGVNIGIEAIDKELMRLFYGTLTIFTGSPASGKTSLLYNLACQSLEQGKGVWIFSKELPAAMTRNWFNYIMAGRRNLERYETREGTEFYKVKNTAKNNISKHYSGRWFVYRDDQPTDLKSLLVSAEETVRRFGVKTIIVDNLMTIDMGANENNEFLKQTEVIKELISFAIKFNVAVILVAHPRKLAVGTEVSMYDISGTANIANLSHRTIGVARVTADMKKGTPNKNGKGWLKEPNPYDVTFSVIKDRMLGKMGYQCGLYYDNASRRFFTNEKEYDFKYSWDNKSYENPLPYPSRCKDNTAEVFGEVHPE
jgi:twinkle protein